MTTVRRSPVRWGRPYDAQDVAPQLVRPSGLVGGGDVADPVRDPVVGQLGPHVPRADRRGLAVVPHPPPVQVAGGRADADAAEVGAHLAVGPGTLIENQRHICGPPQRRGPHDLSRLPRAVAASSRQVSPSSVIVPSQVPDCSRWPLPTVDAVDAALSSLRWVRPGAVGADGRDERREREVHRQVAGPARPGRDVAVEVVDLGLGVGGEPPPAHGLEALVADAAHVEVAVGHDASARGWPARWRCGRRAATPTARRRSCPRWAARRCG